jgi:ABC-type nitrate/sulfonate/bicarbonate transport system substrate-binding protein
VTVLAGLHRGCYELFAQPAIASIGDLAGRRVGVPALRSSPHLYLSVMAAHVGLDPERDIDWVTGTTTEPMELYAAGEIDAFLGFPPEPQALRARGIGRVLLDTATERPWSQYYCCMLLGNRQFVQDHPVATKRVLRAIFKVRRLLRRRAAGGRAPARRARLRRSPRLRHANPGGGAVRRVARLRPGGHDALLCPAAARGGHDPERPEPDHRRGHRLAFSGRDQA